jgi:hypothetical protein
MYPICNARAPYCHLWPVRLYNIFPHYLINGAIFEKRAIEHKMCAVIFLQLLSKPFLILRRTERDMMKTVYWYLCKVPIILIWSEWNMNVLEQFSKDTQMWYFVKIRPVGAELFRADRRTDRQTDMAKVIVFFFNLRTHLESLTANASISIY